MKRFYLICTLWTLLTLTSGLFGVWRIHTHPVPGMSAEVRAGKLGLSIGALTATGYAMFWLILSLTARKKRPPQEQEPKPTSASESTESGAQERMNR